MAVSDPEKYADTATSRQIAPKTAPIDELSKNLCLPRLLPQVERIKVLYVKPYGD
tara:strand:+ start:254 stop:418 length:165 start_codon:yes stop_codon:yes gene_type:complete